MHSLEKHLSSKHKDDYNEFLAKKTHKRSAEDEQESIKLKQQKITKYSSDENSTLMSLCVGLAVNGGRPFSMFDDWEMQRILEKAKASSNDSTTISAETVKKVTQSQAAQKRKKLAQMLKNQILNLSLDFATCQHRYFFGKTS